MPGVRYARLRMIRWDRGTVVGVLEVASSLAGPWRRPGPHLLRRLHRLILDRVNGILIRDTEWRPMRRRMLRRVPR